MTDRLVKVKVPPLRWMRWWAAVLLISAIGCSPESSRPAVQAPPPALDSTPPSQQVQEVDEVTEANKREIAALSMAEGRVSRKERELLIQLLSGKTLRFPDDTTPGLKFRLPRYAGYLKPIHAHVIHLLQYEGSGAYIVLDDSTGDSTIVFGMPVASPDSSRFVLTSMGDEAGYDANLIEVWRMNGRKPEKEFSLEDPPWGPSDAVWRDSTTIEFMKNRYLSPGGAYVGTRGHLTRSGTTWTLRDAPSAGAGGTSSGNASRIGGPQIAIEPGLAQPSLELRDNEFVVRLPAEMAEVLYDSLPGFAPLPRYAFDPELVAWVDRDAASAAQNGVRNQDALLRSALSVVVGDFNGDSKADVAMKGVAGNTNAVFFLLAPSGPNSRVRLIHFFPPVRSEAWSRSPSDEYLTLVRPGKVDGFGQGNQSLTLLTDAVDVAYFEKASRLYYLDGDVVRTFTTSD